MINDLKSTIANFQNQLNIAAPKFQGTFSETPALTSLVPDELKGAPVTQQLSSLMGTNSESPEKHFAKVESQFKRASRVGSCSWPNDVTFSPFVRISIIALQEATTTAGSSSRGEATPDTKSQGALNKAAGKAVEQVGTVGGALSQFSPNKVMLKEVIQLPMPKTFQVGLSAAWGMEDLGLEGGALTDPALAQHLSNMNEQDVKSALAPAVNMAARTLADRASSKGSSIISKATETIPNPFKTQLFTGIEPRSFEFSWTMSARNEAEAEAIWNIIYQLRYHASPEFTGKFKTFMKYPSEFDIEFFISNNERNKAIPRIARCVCNSVNVNYNNGEKWNFFGNAARNLPTHITLTTKFTETQLITKEDVKGEF